MIMQTQQATIELIDSTHAPEPAWPDDWPGFDRKTQIMGLILSDPKAAREALAIFPAWLTLARQKAKSGGLDSGALFCGLDPQKNPCHPDEPPVKPLRLLPSFELSRLLIDYYRTSLDFQFLLSGGADVIFETARLWKAIQSQKAVTAQEEQAELPALVQLNLRWTGRLWTMLDHAGRQQDVASRLGLTEQEIKSFAQLADHQSADQLTTRPLQNNPDTGTAVLKNLTLYGQALPSNSSHHDQDAAFLATLATDLAGLSIEDEELAFKPVLPEGWQSYTLRLTYRGSKFTISIKGSAGKMTLTEGSAIPVLVFGLEYMLEDEFSFDLTDQEQQKKPVP